VKDEIAKAINEQRKDYDEDEVGVSWVSRHWSEIAERAKSERRKQVTIFKRGSVYWFNFMFNGQHIQRSSKQGNPNAARQMMFETGMRPEECTESSHRMFICLRAIYSTPMGRPRPRGVVSNSHPTQEHQTKAMNKMELFVAEQRVAFAERAASSILGLFSDFGVGVTTYPTTVHGKPSGLMV
jgi:hypothetical protein